MNGRPWLPHELAWLREQYGTLLVEDIAQILRRGVPGVRSKILELGLVCRTRWTPELDEFVSLLYPDTPASELAKVLGVTRAALFARCKLLGVGKDRAFLSEYARRTTLARSPFTPEIVATLERLYPNTLTEELSRMVGIPKGRIHAYANSHGWKKTPEFVRETAKARSGPDHPMRQTQFQPGLVPWNKGTRGLVGTQEACRATQFKKGQISPTWRPIGSYRVNADGYLDRKVTDTGRGPRDWQPVHRLVWIEANGPLPDGHLVRFKAGMRTAVLEEITLDRLECVSRREHMLRNSVHNLPPELASLAQLRGALNRQIHSMEKAQEQS